MNKLIALFLVFCAHALAQSGWQYAFDSGGITSISHNGTSYYSVNYRGILFYKVAWDTGEEDSSSCSNSLGADYFARACNPGSPSHIEVRVYLSGQGTDTLGVTVRIYNHSTSGRKIRNVEFVNTGGILLPSPNTTFPTIINTTSLHPREETPVRITEWSTGKAGVYMGSYAPTKMSLGFAISTGRFLPFLTAVEGSSYEIASGSYDENTIYVRMGSLSDTINTLTAPGVELYRQTYKQEQVNEDRRIICAYWMSEKTHQSTTNPRGYLWNSSLDVSNSAAFKSALLARINTLISDCKQHGAQGVIIWDLEGQEFYHPMTYIGSGGLHYQTGASWLSLGAPELEAVVDGEPIVDSMFKLISQSGLKIGLTLRPSTQEFGYGRPMGACHAQGDANGGSYVDLSGTPISRGFICQLWLITFNDETDKVICQDACSGIVNGQAVKFYTRTGVLPASLSMYSTYYVCGFDSQAQTYSIGTTAACTETIADLGGSSGTLYHELWSGPSPNLAQHLEPWNYTQARDNLAAKINYAKQRWGATLFYVDTTMYMRDVSVTMTPQPCSATSPSPFCRATQTITKELWRELNAQWPDVLIMPENSDADPYTASFYSTNISQWGRWSYKKLTYPDHYVAVHMNAGYTTYISNREFVRSEMRDGVIYILSVFSPPTGSTNPATYVMQDLETLKLEIGTLLMTDTSLGSTRVFTGSPATVGSHNAVMRVAFKGDEGSFTGYETTYCEKRSTTRCWLDGVEQSTASLNLSGYTNYRVEYRAWGTGRLISVGYGGSL